MPYTTINKGSSYFNTVLYTGNGASPRSITGVGFKPDFVWSKSRSTVENHNLYDAVRGGANSLRSNLTNAENASSIYGYVSTFDSDGVTYISGGTNNDLNNGNGVTFVNWNWLGANTTVTNTSGSRNSTVSANTTSGFSIVSYTGNSTVGTIGHGLGVAPSMMIIKDRTSGTYNWTVYHASIGNTRRIILNSSAAQDSPNSVWWNNTSPTSTVFTVGTDNGANANGDSFIAYCFAEIKGFSKFSSYVGNGSTNGTFIYTGFKPAFVLIKSSSTAENWHIFDDVRNTFNPADKDLRPNTTGAETTSSLSNIDFVSNGFKLRNADADYNGSGTTYIYMAFAENPFVTSGGIPITAR